MSKIAQIAAIAVAAVSFVEADRRGTTAHRALLLARVRCGLPEMPAFPCPDDAPDEVRAAFDEWMAANDAERFTRDALERAVDSYRDTQPAPAEASP
jgi:hypothetical protein